MSCLFSVVVLFPVSVPSDQVVEANKGGLRGKNYEKKVECVKGPWRLSRYFFFLS